MNRVLLSLAAVMTAVVVIGAIPVNPVFSKEAVSSYAIKAQAGDPDSQYLYAWALHKGLGCKKNLMLAYEYASKAAENHVGEALYLLVIGNQRAWNAHRDYKAAESYAQKYYQWAKREVDATGDVRARCALARCYDSNYGVETNISTAIEQYTIAAEAGSIEAAEILYETYSTNQSLYNRDKALHWAHVAAEHGSLRACTMLGDLYGRLGGMNKDYKESIKWLRKAADGGENDAMFYLGYYYEFGHGVPTDLVEALSWYKKSAEAGYEPAYVLVSFCYFNGKGTEKNESEGVRWCLKAIKAGFYGLSAEVLAHCYGKGIGVHQDAREAKRWLRIARGKDGVDIGQLFDIPFGADIAPLMDKLGVGAQRKKGLVFYELGEIGTPDPKRLSVPGSRDFRLMRPNTLVYDSHNKELVAIIAFMPQEWVFDENQVSIVFEEIMKGIKKIVGKAVSPDHEFLESTHTWTWKVIDKRGRDSEICVKAMPVTKGRTWRFSMLVASYVPKDDETTFSASVSTGTGWWINKRDLITCWHVVKEGNTLYVELKSGVKHNAKIVARDIQNDIAVLRTAGEPLPIVPMRLNTKRVKVSDRVFTFGYPLPSLLGQTQKYTEGVISSLTGIADDARYYQISVPIQPGNSGGALVDQTGEVIGMTTSALDAFVTASMTGTLPQNVNYALKSRYIAALLDDSDIPYNVDCAGKTNPTVETASDATVLVIAEH